MSNEAHTPIVVGSTDALVIVDMQNDFCLPGGALFVAGVQGEPTMEKVIDNVEKLSYENFHYIVATRDQHPDSRHVEFYIYGRHVIEGTSGAEFVRPLHKADYWADYVLTKGENKSLISYSAAVSTEWGRLICCLRARGIRRIFVCGVAYTHCAGETAISLAVQNVPVGDASWEVFIVRDTTRSVSPPYGDPDLMAKKLALYGVKEVFVADLGVM